MFIFVTLKYFDYGRKNLFCEFSGILNILNIRSNYIGSINCHKTVSWYFNANFSVARVLAEDNHWVAHSRQLLLAQRKCSQGLNLDQFNISDSLSSCCFICYSLIIRLR